jgi:hypothetical protein
MADVHAAFAGDALNPVVPTDVTGLGHWWFEDMSSQFTNFNRVEATAYVGPVLLAIVIGFAVIQWRRPATRVLVPVIAVCNVLSLGTSLHVAGDDPGVWMPWALLHPLPIFDHVISACIWAFALLAIAIVVALWLAIPSSKRGLKWAAAAVGAALLIPNLTSDFWSGRPTNPPFFTTDTYYEHLREGDTVLVLPFARNGSSMLWQAETRMYFKMGRGLRVGGVPPPGLPRRPVPRCAAQRAGGGGGHRGSARLPDAPQGDRGRGGGGGSRAMALLARALRLKHVRAGGVFFYRVPESLDT